MNRMLIVVLGIMRESSSINSIDPGDDNPAD